MSIRCRRRVWRRSFRVRLYGSTIIATPSDEEDLSDIEKDEDDKDRKATDPLICSLERYFERRLSRLLSCHHHLHFYLCTSLYCFFLYLEFQIPKLPE